MTLRESGICGHFLEFVAGCESQQIHTKQKLCPDKANHTVLSHCFAFHTLCWLICYCVFNVFSLKHLFFPLYIYLALSCCLLLFLTCFTCEVIPSLCNTLRLTRPSFPSPGSPPFLCCHGYYRRLPSEEDDSMSSNSSGKLNTSKSSSARRTATGSSSKNGKEELHKRSTNGEEGGGN